MKKSIYLVLFALLIQGLVSAQSCLPDGIIFNTQAAIDSFQINYPNCTEIEGSVSLTGEDITNLQGLNSLTAVGGGLAILQNPVLNSLAGLDNLHSINEYLVFLMNDSLASLTALENLTFLGGHLDIDLISRLQSYQDLIIWIPSADTLIFMAMMACKV